MRSLILIAVITVLICAGCAGGSNTGLYPWPVRIPEITRVIVPETAVAAGETVVLTVEWINGREPFEVTWTVGGDEEGETFDAAGRSHNYELTAVNETAGELELPGTVEIEDEGGNSVLRVFTITIAPPV